MAQAHGRRYEHDLSRGLDAVTPEEVWVTTAGYSGNAVVDACDLVITIDPLLATRADDVQVNVEAKKRQGEGGKRTTVFSGGGSESGLEELRAVTDNAPSWAQTVAAIKFDHRRLAVVDTEWLLTDLTDVNVALPPAVQETLDVLDPRLTPSDNVSMVKPPLGEWESAQASEADEIVLAEALDLPLAE